MQINEDRDWEALYQANDTFWDHGEAAPEPHRHAGDAAAHVHHQEPVHGELLIRHAQVRKNCHSVQGEESLIFS